MQEGPEGEVVIEGSSDEISVVKTVVFKNLREALICGRRLNRRPERVKAVVTCRIVVPWLYL